MTSWCRGPTNASSRRWAPRWNRSPRWITLQGIDERKMLSFRGKDPVRSRDDGWSALQYVVQSSMNITEAGKDARTEASPEHTSSM